jgi:hypothetical protein
LPLLQTGPRIRLKVQEAAILGKNDTSPRYADIANQLEREIATLGPNSLLATEEQLMWWTAPAPGIEVP